MKNSIGIDDERQEPQVNSNSCRLNLINIIFIRLKWLHTFAFTSQKFHYRMTTITWFGHVAFRTKFECLIITC
ncbi:CLUMA_CG006386, isoform A [Clunio marinus]|uniref:CLUMA_CG006386, isoform A n=1 Tax=Clunio marinus TaxID=568069 RepID=A0A1J1HXL9_9DIPT|nr:CLUMA_CG006386, isoform A [Clunio marinus]